MRLFGFGENVLRKQKQYSFPTPPEGGGFLTGLTGLTPDRMDTVNEVNNVRRQYRQSSQY